jgi:hypothetical protein
MLADSAHLVEKGSEGQECRTLDSRSSFEKKTQRMKTRRVGGMKMGRKSKGAPDRDISFEWALSAASGN